MLRGILGIMTEDDLENAILKLAETPADAKSVVDYLVTVDWEQVFQNRKQRAEHLQQIREHRLQEVIHAGGGFCDECKELKTRIYHCPFSFDDSKKTSVRLLVPIQHRRKWTDTGKYCWKCIREFADEWDISREKRKVPCSKCLGLFPYDYLHYDFDHRSEWNGYCPSCLEEAIEAKTITCTNCGERTIEYVSPELCNDCYVKPPSLPSVIANLARARKVNAPATLTAEQWIKAVEYFLNKCAYCGIRPYQVLEHYMPVILSGGTTAENCVPACNYCNSRKGNRHPDDFTHLFPAENIARIRGYFESVSSLVLDL